MELAAMINMDNVIMGIMNKVLTTRTMEIMVTMALIMTREKAMLL